MNLDDYPFSEHEKKEIHSLLKQSKNQPPQLEDIWFLMDMVWDNYECDNLHPDNKKLTLFYEHPVWILNGLFIEQDEISMQHRQIISDWIANKKINSILDYGGGFGTFARLLSQKKPDTHIDILEPHPSRIAIEKNLPYPNITFSSQGEIEYDCIVSIDVLEHVEDPLSILAQMIKMLRIDGILILANNFYPVIKCHLPCTFHFRYSFNLFALLMDLKILGSCSGSHARIYQKKSNKPLNWKIIRNLEKISLKLYPTLQRAHFLYKKIKAALRK